LNQKVLLILFAIIFYHQFSFAQKIEPGKYVSVISYDHITNRTVYNSEFREEISILDNINFSYRYCNDFENDIGYGTYLQENRSLILEFIDKQMDFDTASFVIVDSTISTNDTINIKLKLTDEEGALNSAFIAYWKGSEKILSMPSNKDGVANLKIPKQDLGGLLQVSYIGYETVKFYLFSVYNKSINIHLKVPFTLIPKGKTLTYSIKNISYDGFYAKESAFSEWVFFKREE
jgi:hypothetical protein